MIIVLDFGGQYAHLIARRIKDLGTQAAILPYHASVDEIRKHEPLGIVLSGAPAAITEKDAIRPDMKIMDFDMPILGICYGEQLMAQHYGGSLATRGAQREYGKEEMQVKGKNGIFKGLKDQETVWMSHGDAVEKLPKGFTVTGSTRKCAVAAFENSEKKRYGLQFHPEVVHTKNGSKILENFVFRICGAAKDYSLKGLDEQLSIPIQKEVGKEGVLIAVSGGVDSLVTAALLHRAVPENLYCVLIDTGLMRKGEIEETSRYFQKQGFQHFEVVNAEKRFLERLQGILDPEKKREAIGHTFIEVFEEKARELGKKANIRFLAQGTIYPDRIESAQASGAAEKIKSHHNLTLPEKMHLKVIEPLKDLYKDEVRHLGEILGLPKERVWRQPFPGPGLAIRILGEVTPDRLSIVRETDYVYREEIRKAGLDKGVWQYFTALIPVKVVGVMADKRTYEYMIALRAVTSKDGMTADFARIPMDVLERISSRIVNDVKGVNRVLYDVSQKPPSTIEYE
ncbi:glutamine-hydrolyzing GMP synthase [Candidatus Micrarchaeota archaeon]|nr:glutamine-hydrolyzing GMP synthase [Candidatus Micrarchaeota archaeon]